MTLTDVGTRYNGMELSPERVAAFFSLPPAPLCRRGVGGGFIPNPFTAHIDFDDTDTDVLMEADDLRGVGDEAVGELGDVDKVVLMDTDVDESTEVGDVRYDASEFHSYDEVVEGVDILVELEDFNLSTWVTSRLLKLGEDVT